MNKVKKILWGAVLIIFGVLLALDMLDVVGFSLLFRGWWMLFIIVPCMIGLITDKKKLGSLIGLAIGIALLLAARDIITYGMIWKLAIPAAIVIVGLNMIFRAIGRREAREVAKKLRDNEAVLQTYCATFAGLEPELSGTTFTGADATAIFAGVKLDLRNAVINEDAVIKATAIFGGIDILVPDDLEVKLSSTSVFGSAENKRACGKDKGTHTLYVSATCVFGGVEIK